MAAHRYWRIYATSVNSGGLMGAEEVYFRATPGGQDLCGSGTPFASSEYSRPEYAAVNAFDRTFNRVFATGTGAPCWLAYDFLTPVEVQEVEWQARDLGGQSPRDVQLQWSDDLVTWTTVATMAWGDFRNRETKRINAVLPVFPAGRAPHRYWAIQVDGSADPDSYWSVTQMELRAAIGGLDVTDYHLAGYSFDSRIWSDPRAAFDNTDYRNANIAYSRPFGTRLLVDFGADKAFTIAEMTVRARGDGYHRQGPLSGQLLWSDDGTTYEPYADFAFGPWSSGQTQTATLSNIRVPEPPAPEEPPASQPRKRRRQSSVC